MLLLHGQPHKVELAVCNFEVLAITQSFRCGWYIRLCTVWIYMYISSGILKDIHIIMYIYLISFINLIKFYELVSLVLKQ